jgi:hypothetical protein
MITSMSIYNSMACRYGLKSNMKQRWLLLSPGRVTLALVLLLVQKPSMLTD